MKTTWRFAKIFSRPAAVLALAAVLGGGIATTLLAADPATDTKKSEPAKKKLTGAELYAINCNRCHQERYPTEFNSAQWQTLITHMRVRANLPAKQAKEILKYMKEEAGG
jgi:mono/diheme cytochrome c family protein